MQQTIEGNVQAAISNRKFPSSVEQFFIENPEYFEAVQPFLDKPDWDLDSIVEAIYINIDDVTRAVIRPDSEIETVADIPDKYRVYEIEFDDEKVLVTIDSYVILSRLGPSSLEEYVTEKIKN